VKADQNVPVVVYIHGGSFNFGSSDERDIASFVAWSEDPIIGVSLNYRVGALGFLNSNITAEEGILNLGLKDQFAALEWVQENIGAFGGNKNRVTIWGSSAGAHSVSGSQPAVYGFECDYLNRIKVLVSKLTPLRLATIS
jgi:carboxylesterase type B